ncbi:MAG: hypothetical protein AB8B69_23900 [Chitinophagales bacterium]
MKDRKLKLIQDIINLKTSAALSKIEQQVKLISESETSKHNLWEAIKPIKKSVSIEEMIVEQNYTPIKKADFYKKTSKLNIKEPLEDLLSMLD